jgi:feruloyl-CoA synthase
VSLVATAPTRVRRARLGPLDAVVDRRADGTVYVRSPHALAPHAAKLTERLEHWAELAPDRTFLAERDVGGAWRRVTYADALARVRRIAQALLDRRLSGERPIAILSGNGIEHGLLALAAMYVGVPYAPIAPAYSLMTRGHDALRHVLDLMRPALVFAAEGAAYAHVLPLAVGAEIVVSDPSPPSTRTYGSLDFARDDGGLSSRASAASRGIRTTPFRELASTPPTAAVDAAHAAVGPDTIAKILFTSGSTGLPKGVITTQRMLCSNQQMLRTVLAFLAEEPPVLCDWLPWNHVFGGSHNFGMVLYNGGSLYVDEGRPTPAGISATIRNLREIASTAYFNVPRGYEMLVPYLRTDAELRERFFSRVEILFYAAAGLGQRFWDELQTLAVETCGERIRMVTGLGATESAPFAMCVASDDARAGMVGLPVPGVELKVVPAGATLEARLRGPNITPGFWRQEALTSAAFDEEGYYRLGDALAWVDPGDPSKGFAFDGRLNEDFKLSTGTWVRVGPLRARLLARLAPFAHDVVLAAPDRAEVAALVFPNLATCRTLCPELGSDAAAGAVLGHAEVRRTIAALLRAAALESTGSSTCVERAMLLEEPPSMESGELTDKGSINQRAVLRNRAAMVDELYATTTATRAIVAHPVDEVGCASPESETAHG